ncbi:hypothetical protein FGB62_103g018 [Gracilaria domingensis]|nr:hypothetical protein FGB62_103g018 [Gracilaria domingensis]
MRMNNSVRMEASRYMFASLCISVYVQRRTTKETRHPQGVEQSTVVLNTARMDKIGTCNAGWLAVGAMMRYADAELLTEDAETVPLCAD